MTSITIVLTRYSEPDQMVRDCLESLALQKAPGISVTVLFLDQQRAGLQRYCAAISTENISFVYQEILAKSLSYARNIGIKESKTDLVLFCDVDCTFESNWVSEIVDTFDATSAAVVGTKIVPKWSMKPYWYHHSPYVLEFYSMLDLGIERKMVNKVIGASFAIDKSKLGKIAYFDENLGRVSGKLLGGEETDLCIRVGNAGMSVYYTPDTFIHHRVEPERIKLTWLIKRAYFGGISRSKRGGSIQTSTKSPLKLRDRMALALIAPAYITGLIRAKF